MYTPPSVEGTIVQPGIHGGNEWGGPAFDPETNTAYVNVNDFPFLLTLELIKPDQVADEDWIGGSGGERIPGWARESGDEITEEEIRKYTDADIANYLASAEEDLTWSGGSGALAWSTSTPQYVPKLDYFTDHMGYHGIKPPWGKLLAVNIESGDINWSIPLGEYPGLVEMGIRHTGAENFGGMAVTKGGLIFIAATEDSRFRAFDKTNGELLWEFEMDAPGFATPSVYEIDGRQYVVIVAGGGGGRYRSPVTGPLGKRVHAFALPVESEAQ